MSTNRCREEDVCDRVFRFLDAHRGPACEVSRPDRDKPSTDRQPQSVERVWRCRDGLVVVEHTLVESFPEQLAKEAALRQVMDPVMEQLEALLPAPGRYHLGIEQGSLLEVSKRGYPEMQRAIVAWAMAEAKRFVEQAVEADEDADPLQEATGRPAGVPFSVTLERRLRGQRAVIPVRALKADLEARRSARMETAIRRKAPKLEAAKSEVTAVASLLIVEADDIQLSNWSLVNRAFKAAAGSAEAAGVSMPDWVYLVETDGEPFCLWILKGDGVPATPGSHQLRRTD